MFKVIDSALLTLLKQKVELPDDALMVGDIDPKERMTFPCVAFRDEDFTLEELSLGSEGNETREKSEETFSGDGETKAFKLSSKPLRPTVKVESPPGVHLKQGVDFTVDYESGEVVFSSPPGKGQKNITISYNPSKGVAVDRGLKASARYYIDVWADGRDSCDAVAVKIVEALLIGRDDLAKLGVHVRPLGGCRLKVEGLSKIVGRRLEYIMDTEVHVRIPVPPIEKIELQRRPLPP